MLSQKTGGRRWLITGISSGIGAALADAAFRRGDSVIGMSRDGEALSRFEAQAPGRALGLQLDMADSAQVEAIAERMDDIGPVDILVNNAGQSLFGAFEEVSVAEARALFDVNLFGPWALTRALLPHFRAQGKGTIVQISSGCGLSGTPGLSAYCASKFALEGLTETLAQEVTAFGIRTMLVEPGAIATRFISHGTRDAGVRIPAYDFLSGQGRRRWKAIMPRPPARPNGWPTPSWRRSIKINSRCACWSATICAILSGKRRRRSRLWPTPEISRRQDDLAALPA